jgi:hypothetical protein
MPARRDEPTSIGFTQQDNSTDGMEAIKPAVQPRSSATGSMRSSSSRRWDRMHDRARGRQAAGRSRGAAREKGVHRSLDDAARRWIADKGYDPKMGARPMARRDPGADQAAAGRRTAVRHAREWRAGAGDEHMPDPA